MDGEWKFSPSDGIKRDQYGNINNIIDTSNYTKNEIDSLSNSQKSSYNNGDKIDKKVPNPKLGKVDEETQENLPVDDDPNKKPGAPFVLPGQNSSSKNFDLRDFAIENNENLFDIEAPLIPTHLSQISFLNVCTVICYCFFF